MDLVFTKFSRFDFVFIIGITLLASVMAGVTVIWPLLFIPMLTVHSWLFGYEHLWSTYTRLLFHSDDRKKFWPLVLIVPPIVFLILLKVGANWGLKGIFLLYFVGQFYHTVRQSWGILQSYRRNAGGLSWDSEVLSEVTVWSVPIWGFLYRCSQRPDEFLFQEFWLPPVPKFVVDLVGVITLMLWLYWVYSRIISFRRGKLPMGHSIFMVSHFFVFFVGYIFIDELCSGWLLVNVWHNVQYIVFVWVYNRSRFRLGIDPKAKVLSWLSQVGSGNAILYFLFTITLALPIYYLLPELGYSLDEFFKRQLVPMSVVLAMSLTFHHYIIDGVIWKGRNNTVSIFHT
ncbi:hypothetical protein EHQ46_04855 [Leptospira yanagawae]|uniref:Beta-carotene 15,15'-monooxygenase n=1 Tax=Leptospira yanagawae TaxID=293069 RepID=A0ABY2M8K0_9LEPT|nr:hypothetical protein [Leptospira yanagawae]TGL24448.1 hypothetical protein EHQ46_04855 [Leptospira yanagawae]